MPKIILTSGTSSDRSERPKHSARELVCKMRDERGITFSYITEQDAEHYLSDINNYLRIASYRKNYEKNQAGENKGKYQNLDFAYLVDLSAIDMHLRYLILKMQVHYITGTTEKHIVFARTKLRRRPIFLPSRVPLLAQEFSVILTSCLKPTAQHALCALHT